jgi:hypothetical protein
VDQVIKAVSIILGNVTKSQEHHQFDLSRFSGITGMNFNVFISGKLELQGLQVVDDRHKRFPVDSGFVLEGFVDLVAMVSKNFDDHQESFVGEAASGDCCMMSVAPLSSQTTVKSASTKSSATLSPASLTPANPPPANSSMNLSPTPARDVLCDVPSCQTNVESASIKSSATLSPASLTPANPPPANSSMNFSPTPARDVPCDVPSSQTNVESAFTKSSATLSPVPQSKFETCDESLDSRGFFDEAGYEDCTLGILL